MGVDAPLRFGAPETPPPPPPISANSLEPAIPIGLDASFPPLPLE